MPLSDRDRRTLRIGGIVAGVLVVGLVLFNVLSGGGGTETALPPTACSTRLTMRSTTSTSERSYGSASVRHVPDNTMHWFVLGGTAAFLGVIWMAIWLAAGK